jgi:ribonuclease R
MSREPKNSSSQIGTVKRHPDGFGFFIPDNAGTPDVYIPKQFMNGVMTNDKVEVGVYPEPGGKRFRGEVIKIVDRAHKKVIGKYQHLNDQQGIILDTNNNWGANLTIPTKFAKNAKPDDLVIVEITSYPTNNNQFLGKITEVLGDANDPMYDTKKVIINHKIPHEFSGAVDAEAAQIPEEVDPKKYKDRRDLTNTNLITIDGKTAKDFDDAIFVEQTSSGFHLIVAIADVSHYVKIGSAIDTEAYERGTSVYFPNFVVPMLPEVLSNGLCSLKPKVPRLCLVADMHFDFQGVIQKSEFYEAIMNSKARVTYGEAQEVIEGRCPEQFEHVKEMILKAAGLAKLLMARRFQAGSLDLEIPETELIIDESGCPIDIIRAERIFAHRLIEEMMLAANVEVAKFIGKNNSEVLYRIHEPPKLEKIEALNNHLHNFGSQITLSTNNLQKNLGKALHEFTGTPQEIILNILILRSMNQAKYSPDNVGHFGLGFEDYCHFTSPIRRYPDLIVHRVLKNILRVPGYEIPVDATLATAGTMLSACEQRSVKSERQLHSIKKARFMAKYVGEEFEGVISSVAKFGVFVLLRQFDVDGLVKVEDLGDDQFFFEEADMMLRGKRSGLEYKLGDTVKIQVAACDVELGQINFVLLDQPVRSSQSKDDRMPFGKRQNKNRPRDRDEKSFRSDRKGKRSDKNASKESQKRSFKPSRKVERDDRSERSERSEQPSRPEKLGFRSKNTRDAGREFQRPMKTEDPNKKPITGNMEKILKMLDEGASRGNHTKGFSNREDDKERRSGKDDRRSAGKARLSKRPGKGKTR